MQTTDGHWLCLGQCWKQPSQAVPFTFRAGKFDERHDPRYRKAPPPVITSSQTSSSVNAITHV
jgi:hypothetical protein